MQEDKAVSRDNSMDLADSIQRLGTCPFVAARPLPVTAAAGQADAMQPGAGGSLLEVHDLTCIRRHRILFRNLDFTLAAGQWLLISGPNGSGKTSLLRILCGLLQPDAGSVRWEGSTLKEPTARAQIAYLGHTHGVKVDLTPYENLQIARRLGLNPGLTADEALERLGLACLEDVPCHTLSAGQRRRVALARLLVVQTRLWILDEPLTALDSAGIGLFQNMLDTHLNNGGLAVVSTHQSLDEVTHPCREIGLGND